MKKLGVDTKVRRCKSRLLIIGKGGEKAGMGHLVRLSSIVKLLFPFYSIDFYTNQDGLGENFLRCQKIPFSTYRDDRELYRHIQKKSNYDLAIIDMYRIPMGFVRRAENNCSSFLLFDDLQKINHNQVRGVVVCPQEAYKRSIESKTKAVVFKGTDYFSLRDAFAFHRKHKAFKPHVGDIAFFLGGASPLQDMMPLVKSVDKQLDKKIRLHVVLGYGVEKTYRRVFSKRVVFYSELKNMAALIARVDMGVISGGFAKFEFMCIGTPIIFVPVNSHQERLAKRYSSQGYGVYVGKLKDVLKNCKKLIAAINNLEKSENVRKKMFHHSRNLVDGKGSSRILNIIHDLV